MDLAPEVLAPLFAESRRHEAAALGRLRAAAWSCVEREQGARGAAATQAPGGGTDAAHAAESAARVLLAARAAEAPAATVKRARDAALRTLASDALELPAAALVAASLLAPPRGAGTAVATAGGALRVPDALVAAVDRVLAAQARDGGFRLAAGARGVDVRATARAVVLLARLAASGSGGRLRAAEVERAARRGATALVARMRPDGTWAQRGAPSPALTAEVLLALDDVAKHLATADVADTTAPARARAAAAIARAQRRDGSWGDDCVATAIACTRALHRARASADGAVELRAAELGLAWVLAAMGDRGWGPRPGAVARAAITADAVVLLAEVAAVRMADDAASGAGCVPRAKGGAA